MNLAEFKDFFNSRGIHSIQVEEISSFDNFYKFTGSLEEFVTTLEAIDCKIIFFSILPLQEELFHYDPQTEENLDTIIDQLESVSEIYLPERFISLEKFLSYKNQIGIYFVFANIESKPLGFELKEDWWDEFITIWSDARETIYDEINSQIKEIEYEKTAFEKLQLRNLRNLISDEKFISLPTQKAMLAYALNKFPDLNKLDSHTLKVEIQDIVANLKASE